MCRAMTAAMPHRAYTLTHHQITKHINNGDTLHLLYILNWFKIDSIDGKMKLFIVKIVFDQLAHPNQRNIKLHT